MDHCQDGRERLLLFFQPFPRNFFLGKQIEALRAVIAWI